MQHKIGKIQKVALREIWKHEAADFTQWLAKNIEFINDVVKINITVLKVEGNVGPYRVDIYGEDDSNNKVIIENQLEKTDHSHLGQLLSYLVNLEAKIAIWITANPIEEHRKVISWLNENTPDDMFFYLIKVEGIKIGEQPAVAPLFTLVEGSTQETKKIGAEKKEYAHRHIIRKEFWSQFIESMNKESTLCQNLSPSTNDWIRIYLGMTGVSINLVISRNYARSEVYINRGNSHENKEAFDYLYKHKKQIEKDFGGRLIWERMDDKVTSRIKYQLDEVNVFNKEDWPKMKKFMIDAAKRMHKAFTNPVQQLRSHL